MLSDICNKQSVLEGGPLKPDALTEDGSWVHHHLGSPRACGASSVLRRSKSLTSPVTRIVLVEDWEEEGEDETAPWNRMVGVYLFNRLAGTHIISMLFSLIVVRIHAHAEATCILSETSYAPPWGRSTAALRGSPKQQ